MAAARPRLRGETADTQRERRAVEDRLALLEEWRRNLEGFSDGVRAPLQGEYTYDVHVGGRVSSRGTLAAKLVAPQG